MGDVRLSDDHLDLIREQLSDDLFGGAGATAIADLIAEIDALRAELAAETAKSAAILKTIDVRAKMADMLVRFGGSGGDMLHGLYAELVDDESWREFL